MSSAVQDTEGTILAEEIIPCVYDAWSSGECLTSNLSSNHPESRDIILDNGNCKKRGPQ